MSAPVSPRAPAGAIYDTGYGHYSGERRGVTYAMRSVAIQAVLRVLGIRRPLRNKIIPTITVFLCFVPAIVFIGVAVLIPDEIRSALIEEPSASMYADYYGTIVLALVLFASFSGPEILCPDRRTGMLGLYLASPLDRNRYLVGKSIGIATVLGIVTIGPPLLLLIGYVVVGSGPDGPIGVLSMLVRIVVAGAVISALYTSLSMAVSSVAKRNGAATAAIVVIMLSSVALTGALVEGAGADDHVALVNLLTLPLEVVYRVYGESSVEDDQILNRLSTGAVVGAYVGWVAVFSTFVWWRYRRLDVTR
jgi:ABC-2 type transport system permease protein